MPGSTKASCEGTLADLPATLAVVAAATALVVSVFGNGWQAVGFAKTKESLHYRRVTTASARIPLKGILPDEVVRWFQALADQPWQRTIDGLRSTKGIGLYAHGLKQRNKQGLV